MAFMGRVQFREEHSPAGFAGHYGFSHFAVPQAANTAAMTEAAVATYRLARHHGQAAPGLYDQIEASLDALARGVHRVVVRGLAVFPDARPDAQVARAVARRAGAVRAP